MRRRIARAERLGQPNARAISLGAPGIDAHLPGGGLKPAALHEVLPETYGDFPAAAGFLLGVLSRAGAARRGDIVWAVAGQTEFQDGALYPPGLSLYGLDPNRLILVRGEKAHDVLWALEEGLGCAALAAVVGILPEKARGYDFTASRRLVMRAGETGVTALLLSTRPGAAPASAAETRWRIKPLPSAGPRWPGQPLPGLGAPHWRAALTKSRRGKPGAWDVEWDHETFSFRLPAVLASRTAVRAGAARDGDSGERRAAFA